MTSINKSMNCCSFQPLVFRCVQRAAVSFRRCEAMCRVPLGTPPLASGCAEAVPVGVMPDTCSPLELGCQFTPLHTLQQNFCKAMIQTGMFGRNWTWAHGLCLFSMFGGSVHRFFHEAAAPSSASSGAVPLRGWSQNSRGQLSSEPAKGWTIPTGSTGFGLFQEGSVLFQQEFVLLLSP